VAQRADLDSRCKRRTIPKKSKRQKKKGGKLALDKVKSEKIAIFAGPQKRPS
jgi:hypothetical protein